MNASPPMISVLMAVFNGEKFLSQSIESILSQTYEEFEFIIVDDGSLDSSWNIILKFREADSRICPVRLEKNQGVAVAANVGLKIARGKYIARMDADDISLPDRFAKQVAFLENHPDFGILGGCMRFMNENGNLLRILPVFENSLDTHWAFMFESPFYNPTVMFRKALVDQYALQYDPSIKTGEEDYELWSRFLPITKGANLPSVLVNYRINSQSLTYTHTNNRTKAENVIRISTVAVKNYLPEISLSEKKITELQRAIQGISPIAKRQRSCLISIYFEIWDAFCQKNQGVDLSQLKKKVFAWAARMILYPLFQPGSLKALWFLTKKDWRWPLYLLSNIPYYISRRL